jgi:acyl-CoA synthetase (NDP forming)
VVAFSRLAYSLADESRAFQDKAGMPFLQGIENTLRAVKGLGFYAHRREHVVRSVLPPAARELQNLEEKNLQRQLANYGISFPRQAAVRTVEEAVLRAAEIGFPVALKILAPSMLHKTEAGAVALGLRDAAEVKRLGEKLAAKAPADGELLVQEMVEGTEMIVGVRSDPQFGPVILVGLGGIFVQVFNDKALRLLPIDDQEVRQMLKELRGAALLEGVRGQAAGDVEALVRAVIGLGSFFAAYRNWIDDLEINPLIVRPGGSGAVAVDVKIIRKK